MNTQANRTEVVAAQEISTFGISERKRHGAVIEVVIPQPKHRKHEIPVRTCRQGWKNKLLDLQQD